jgi:hypothetical protein
MTQGLSVVLMLPETGRSKIPVRFPSDEECTEYRRAKKITTKMLGRGKYQAEQPELKADAELFEKLRQDQDKPFDIDEFAAAKLVEMILVCEALERPTLETQTSFRIRLKVVGGIITEHILKIPSTRAQAEYEKSRPPVIASGYGHHTARINLAGVAELYDKVKADAIGYVGDVPIIHKAEAVNQLLSEIEAIEKGDSELPEA